LNDDREALDPTGGELLDEIVAAAAGTLDAVLFFGSRSSKVATTAASAYDFMLVVGSAGTFYGRMRAAGLLQRSPAVLRLVDPVLRPTQIRLASKNAVAKCSVLTTSDLREATSPHRKDQFIAGRLFQDVKELWTRGDRAREAVSEAVRSARRITLDWCAPDLPPTFDAVAYVRQLFRTSFRFEVRPETRGRADLLFEAQAERLIQIFVPVLAELATEGTLTRDAATGAFALTQPVSMGRRVRRRLFMEWSRVRATARWPKHAITFDGWLDYIVRKAERHSSEPIVLTPLERRFPFIFLWPKALRFLWRQRKRTPPV
jgi:hypothetical protein